MCQTPPSLSDKEGQACSWSPPSGGLAVESKHSLQGQGTEAWGRSFTQSHIIHWELRGQGSPGPLPSMKANQTVKWDASRCWPCRVATFLPWEAPALWSPDSWRPGPPWRVSLGRGGSHRQAWESFGDIGDRVGN